MSSRRPSAVVLAGSLLFLSAAAPACGEEVVDPDRFESGTLEQALGCPPAEWVCANYGGCALTAACEGHACRRVAHGEEIRVSSEHEDEGYSERWRTWHRGNLAGFGNLACEVESFRNRSTVELPPGAHCAAALTTDHHFYLEFFASNPASGCHGWVECRCY